MTLKYRGIAYNQSAVSSSAPATVTGKYRGAEMKISHPAIALDNQCRFNLKYRGVNYQATANPVLPNGLASAF